MTADTQPMPRALRVLVVDDLALNRDIADAFLRAAGHLVTCAEGGAAAVAAAAGDNFDVILMDMRMPGMDGIEATRHIRALAGSRGRAPIVALTAQDFTEQANERAQAGMDGHLAKPFTQGTLLEAVRRAAVAGRSRANTEAVSLPRAMPAASAIAAPGAELPVLDPGAFGRTAAFLAPEMLASYLRTLVGRGEALLRGLHGPQALTRNGRENAAAAHTLAGSAGMFGFERLAAASRRFEHAALTGLAEAPILAESLTAAIKASIWEMQLRLPGAALVSTANGTAGDLVNTGG